MSEPNYYIWASDPHGTGQAWIELVEQAQTKYPNSQTVFGGDYIDGNSQSAETVDLNIMMPLPYWAITNSY